jgi:hypothetical protein
MASADEARQQKRWERRHRVLFVPKRCEVAGCSAVGAAVKRCAHCRCVFYCGREHQQADWARHKVRSQRSAVDRALLLRRGKLTRALGCRQVDCAHVATLLLEPVRYDVAAELAARPLGSAPRDCAGLPGAAAAPDAPPRCSLCGGTTRLQRTRCCNSWVCDDGGDGRHDPCARNHNRFTLCAQHSESRGHTSSADWRACTQCATFSGDLRWRSCNGHNVAPLTLPQATPLTQPCSQCGGRIFRGFESYVQLPSSALLCNGCNVII